MFNIFNTVSSVQFVYVVVVQLRVLLLLQAAEHLQSFIADCDRRTELAKKRLAETQDEISAEVAAKVSLPPTGLLTPCRDQQRNDSPGCPRNDLHLCVLGWVRSWVCVLCLTAASPSGPSGGARPRAERGDREAAGPRGAAGRGGQRGRGPAGPGEGGEDPRPEEGG